MSDARRTSAEPLRRSAILPSMGQAFARLGQVLASALLIFTALACRDVPVAPPPIPAEAAARLDVLPPV